MRKGKEFDQLHLKASHVNKAGLCSLFFSGDIEAKGKEREEKRKVSPDGEKALRNACF